MLNHKETDLQSLATKIEGSHIILQHFDSTLIQMEVELF